jgi:uncharacterized coiled-coil protein SlyX
MNDAKQHVIKTRIEYLEEQVRVNNDYLKTRLTQVAELERTIKKFEDELEALREEDE